MTLKEKINKILGDNIRLLLPSYWWKRLFGMVVDRIDEVHPIVDSANALKKLDVPDGSLASIKGGEWFSLSDAYLMTEEEYKKVGDGEISLLSKCTPVSSIRVFSNTLETESIDALAVVLISDSKFTYGAYIYIYSNGMIIFSDSEDMYEVPLCLEGQLYEENIRKVNKKLSEKDCVITIYDTLSGPISDVDKFVKFSSTPGADVYIKCGSWERLVKESDINITFDSELSKTSKNGVQNKVIAEEFEVIAEEFDKQQCVFVVSSDGTAPENYKQQNKESYNKVCESIDADRWMNVFVLYSAYFRIQVDSITISGGNELVLYATFDNSFKEFRVSSDGSVATQNSGSLKIDSRVSDEIEGKEDKANKTTTLSSASTDTQYPSAKAVYDALQNMEEYVKTYVDNAIKNLNNQ